MPDAKAQYIGRLDYKRSNGATNVNDIEVGMDTKKNPVKHDTGSSKWKPGQCGNPGGRPSTTRAGMDALRRAVDSEGGLDEFCRLLVEDAKAGDPEARRLIVNRLVPQPRPTIQTERVEVQGSPEEQATALLDYANQGLISLEQALLTIDGLAKAKSLATIGSEGDINLIIRQATVPESATSSEFTHTPPEV